MSLVNGEDLVSRNGIAVFDAEVGEVLELVVFHQSLEAFSDLFVEFALVVWVEIEVSERSRKILFKSHVGNVLGIRLKFLRSPDLIIPLFGGFLIGKSILIAFDDVVIELVLRNLPFSSRPFLLPLSLFLPAA